VGQSEEKKFQRGVHGVPNDWRRKPSNRREVLETGTAKTNPESLYSLGHGKILKKRRGRVCHRWPYKGKRQGVARGKSKNEFSQWILTPAIRGDDGGTRKERKNIEYIVNRQRLATHCAYQIVGDESRTKKLLNRRKVRKRRKSRDRPESRARAEDSGGGVSWCWWPGSTRKRLETRGT